MEKRVSKIKTKKCTKCGVVHTGTVDELSEFFPWSNKAKKYLTSLCKSCDRERTREFRNANKDRYNEITRQWREENKDYSKALYDDKKELANIVSGKLFNMDDDKLKEIENVLISRLSEVRKEIEKRNKAN